ncbi:MAG: two pore domain potassium channel family protein [Fuscovulum sp.]|nr:two pore domain potassium channel family protein [Fuscovulum sp.]
MFTQIATGSGLLTLNIIVAALAAFWLELAFRWLHPWLLRPPQRPRLLLLLIGVGLWVLAVITAGVWIWALAYRLLGALPDLETAVYFSLVTFTTLGFGDVILPEGWRLLAGMEAANGFLSFGLLTALLVEALRQVRLSQIETRRRAQDE